MIPEKVLNQHIAILGKTGSGKTYLAKWIAEYLLAAKRRVCIIDPTGVWFGLRSDASGKKAAFPIVVFGGEHADVPLGRNHGAAIAEIVGTTDTPAVLDTRLMTVGDRTQFFTDFGEALLRKNKGPLHLIIDEAHLFAPQGRVNDPQSGKMLHAANNLVSLGRGVGLRVILISQRPAKLHKDSLTQAETLIAMRLIAPQDRRAVEDWIGEWADPKQGAELLKSLPSLPTGEGWLWSPEAGILQRQKFPRIITYDSSRAPDGDIGKIVLANIDLPTIQARLETVAHDAFDNDPKRLRAKLLEVQKELVAVQKNSPKPEIKRVEIPILKNDQLLRLEKAAEKAQKAGEVALLIWREMTDTLRSLKNAAPAAVVDRLPQRPLPIVSRPAQVTPKHQSNGNSSIGGLARKILTVLAQYPQGMGVERLAILANSTVNGHFNSTVSSLRTSGYVTPARVTPIQITEDGMGALGAYEPMPVGAELRAYWISKVGGLKAKILSTLCQDYPSTFPIEALAEACGSTVNGHFNSSVSSLRTMGLMTPARTPIKASDYLFED